MSDEKRDYYEVLGVSKNATDDEIKRSFRKLSLKWHPDRQSGKTESEKAEALKKFQEIAEAYEVLSDKQKRANYDQFGFDGPQMGGGFSGGGFDINDFMRRHGGMFKDFFGMGGDPFGMGGSMFGDFGFERSSHREMPDPTVPEHGRDMRLRITVPFKDAVFGKEREFTIDHADACPKCHGSGIKDGAKAVECSHCHGSGVIQQRVQQGFMISISTGPCPHCNGTGYMYDKCDKCNGNKRIPTKKTIKVAIPAGVEAGQKLRVKGMGEVGTCGGENGDLYIYIADVEKSDLFERSGLHIKVTWPVSPIVATLGGKIEVPAPDGYVKVNVPAGTKSGDNVVIGGKGIKSSSGAGNLIVNFTVEPLSGLSRSQ